MFSRSLSIATACLIVLTAAYSSQAITIGASEDNFVRGGNDANNVQNTNAGMVVKTSTNASFTRKSYVKFLLANQGANLGAGGTFDVLVDNSVNDGGGGTGVLVDVFALNGGDAGFGWDDSTITFNNAPANDTSPATAQFESNATMVGRFFTPYGGTDTLESVFIPNLGDFIQSDKSITLMMVSGVGNSGNVLVNRRAVIFGSESGNGPSLTFEQVPEPTTALLGVMGVAGLVARRRRAA